MRGCSTDIFEFANKIKVLYFANLLKAVDDYAKDGGSGAVLP